MFCDRLGKKIYNKKNLEYKKLFDIAIKVFLTTWNLLIWLCI